MFRKAGTIIEGLAYALPLFTCPEQVSWSVCFQLKVVVIAADLPRIGNSIRAEGGGIEAERAKGDCSTFKPVLAGVSGAVGTGIRSGLASVTADVFLFFGVED